MSSTKPTLWIVATPIGNPGDLSPRAREVLAGADVVLAEDTRRSGLLFKALGLPGGRFVSLHEHNEEARVPAVLEALDRGESVALISDAGTPVLSDPGYRLVRACREAGHRVSPVPGPYAPAAALSACGIAPLPHVFLGFLPRKRGEIVRLLRSFAETGAALVFFERKSRLRASLEAALEALGPREFCVARELTKTWEEFILGDLERLEEVEPDLKGELTVILGPAPKREPEADEAEVEAVLREEREQGGKPREIARRAAARLPGLSADRLYDRLCGRK